MTDNVSLYRVEDYIDDDNHIRYEQSVVCSFKTARFGYLQVKYRDGHGVVELKNEPDLQMLRRKDKKYVELVLAIVWRMIFDVPASTDRFE